jgi:enterochelin esterase-like enzyme
MRLTRAWIAAAIVLAGASAAQAAEPIVVGGQAGWRHDEGDASGTFQTFDALDLPGALRRARKVHVFLPRSYDRGDRRYPVVYFNDGTRTFFHDGGGPSWDLAARLAELYAQGMPEIIAVGVNPTDRDREYTFAPVPTRPTCCELESYAAYLADQLKPFIDASYRTDPAPEHTAIVGSSHGGLAAFVTAARHPESFGRAGCLSSSFWVDMTPFGATTRLADSALLRDFGADLGAGAKPKRWIDWGLVRTGGSHNALIEANATLRSRELVDLLVDTKGYRLHADVETYEDPQGGHDEASWSRRLLRVVPWLVR